MDLAGQDVTQQFSQLLSQEGMADCITSDLQLIRQIKEKICFVAEDFIKAESKPVPQISANYTMPDNSQETIARARYRCIEPLFNPLLLDMKGIGVSKMVHEAIGECPMKFIGIIFE